MFVWHGSLAAEAILVFKKIRFDRNTCYFNFSRGDDLDLVYRMQHHHLSFSKADQARLVHLTMPSIGRKITASSHFTNGAYITLKRSSVLRYYFLMAMGGVYGNFLSAGTPLNC